MKNKFLKHFSFVDYVIFRSLTVLDVITLEASCVEIASAIKDGQYTNFLLKYANLHPLLTLINECYYKSNFAALGCLFLKEELFDKLEGYLPWF